MNRVFEAATNHQPEAEFILGCLRHHKTTEDAARLDRLLDGNLDWNAVLAMARSLAVMPLLCQSLSAMNWDRVPPGPRNELEVFLRNNAAWNLGMAAELIEILKICRANSMTVIPFKGVVLAHQLYGNFALRISNDLDLLVRQRDSTKLRELLALRGYESSWALRDGYNEELLRSQRQVSLTHNSRPWIVEVHTALFDGPHFEATNLDALSSRLENTEICGQSIGILPIDVTLLYLCAHGAKHYWERIGWICDVAQFVQLNPDLDWTAILLRARQLQWERTLLLGLTLAHDLLGISLPKFVEQRMPIIDSLAETVAAKLFATQAVKNGTLWRLRFQLQCRERPRERFWFTLAAVLRPTVADWQALSLPATLSPLYYLLRPIRLIGKYSAQLFSGNRSTTHFTRAGGR